MRLMNTQTDDINAQTNNMNTQMYMMNIDYEVSDQNNRHPTISYE